jgi:hypothetical protein
MQKRKITSYKEVKDYKPRSTSRTDKSNNKKNLAWKNPTTKHNIKL